MEERQHWVYEGAAAPSSSVGMLILDARSLIHLVDLLAHEEPKFEVFFTCFSGTCAAADYGAAGKLISCQRRLYLFSRDRICFCRSFDYMLMLQGTSS